MTQALLAGVFDSRPQPECTQLLAIIPTWIFERRRLASKEAGSTSGHGARSSNLAPTLRLAEAAADVADRKARKPWRGIAHLEPPTRLDALQTVDAGRSDCGAQLDGLLSTSCATAKGATGAKTCGVGGLDK